MRLAKQILLDIGATAQEIADCEAKVKQLRRRLGGALAEARDHPRLTLEAGRKVPGKTISRQTAIRLVREAEAGAEE